ncbi:MAG: phytanoyl-CoA dioxygenase family protein, partial [Pseudomonadota bacterium]
MLDMGHNPLPGLPPVESPLFKQWLAGAGLSEEDARVARDLHEQGFAVIDFPLDDFDQIAEDLKADLLKTPQFQKLVGIGPDKPGEPGGRVMNFVANPHARSIACNDAVIALLSRLYGRRAFPFQTLNFGMGTQQHYHSDSVHFSSVPERFMCGVWVALEDIGPDQGPLVYYPGSHKWPVLYNDDVGHRVARAGKKRSQEVYH